MICVNLFRVYVVIGCIISDAFVGVVLRDACVVLVVVYNVYIQYNIRESVDSLCRDGTDAPIT